MELDGNNSSNFYKQVAPTGLLGRISFGWFPFVEARHALSLPSDREGPG